jgi:hypothetical protein
MEGLLTLPNNAIYGPWAGKLIVGNETTNTLYTIDTNGVVETWNLGTPGFGVAGQAFLVVPGTNDDFYCEDSAWWGPGDSSFSYIRKLPGAFFPTNSGDIIVAQCPEENNNLQPQTIWLLRWNGTAFGTSCLILSNFTEGPLKFSPDFGLVEKGVFAPIHIGTEP